MNTVQKNAIELALKYKGWHSYSQDKETVNIICSLVNLGIIKINSHGQYTLKSKIKANDFLQKFNEEPKHTPLPWHYNKELSSHHTQLVYGSDGRLVADAGRILQRSPEEQEANAKFIERACNAHYELLEALCVIVKTGGRLETEAQWLQIRSVIAKVEGR